MKTKEHKESNGCEKYYCWRYALYKINFWTILKKLLQKNDFRRFPLFEIFALQVIIQEPPFWIQWSIFSRQYHVNAKYLPTLNNLENTHPNFDVQETGCLRTTKCIHLFVSFLFFLPRTCRGRTNRATKFS